MSNRNRHRGRKIVIWSVLWIIWLFCLILSPGLGALIDVYIIFPPRPDVLGHGIPVFTILLPMFTLFIAVIMLLIMVIGAICRAVSSRKQHYEYIKSFWKYSYENEPVLTLHEVDLKAGRRGVRCIEIYRDGHKECLTNYSMQETVPTAEAINALDNFTAYLISEQEFEDIWSS